MASVKYSGSTTSKITVYISGLDKNYSKTDRVIEWYYGTTSSRQNTFAGSQSIGGKISSSPTYSITGLEPGTKYYVRAVITGVWGGTEENPYQYDVELDHPGYYYPTRPNRPSSITVSSITTTSATVKWSQSGEYDQFAYELVDEDDEQIELAYTSSTSVKFTGLTPGMEYTFSVMAIVSLEDDDLDEDDPTKRYYVSGDTRSKSFTTDSVTYTVTAKNTGYTSYVTDVSPVNKSVTEGKSVTFSATLANNTIFTGWYKTSSTSTRQAYYNPYYYDNVTSNLTLYARAASSTISVYNVTATSAYVKISQAYSYYTYRIYVQDDTTGTGAADITGKSSSNITSGVAITGLIQGHNYRVNVGYCYTDQDDEDVTHWISNSGGISFSYNPSVTCTNSTSTSLTFKVTGGTVSQYILWHNGVNAKSATTSNTTITVTGLYPSSTYAMQIYFSDGSTISTNGTTNDPTLSAEVSGNQITVTINGGTAYSGTSWSIWQGSSEVDALKSNSTSYATFTNLKYNTQYNIYCNYRVANGASYKQSSTALGITVTTGDKPPIDLWVWNEDEQEAFDDHLSFNILTYERWNAFLDWCNTVFSRFGATTIGSTYYVARGDLLLADDFNDIVEYIEDATNDSTGIPTVKRGDVVMGEYFYALSTTMNNFLEDQL